MKYKRKVRFAKRPYRKRRGGKLAGRPLKRRRTMRARGRRKYRGSFGVIGSRKFLKMTYVCNGTMGGGTFNDGALHWAPTSLQVYANNPWDPNPSITGTFNQTAAGYKLWLKLFNRYIVRKAVIKTTFCQATAIASSGYFLHPLVVGVRLDDDGQVGSYTGWEQFQGDKYTKYRMLHMGQTGEVNSRVRITTVFNGTRFFGRDKGNIETVGYTSPTNLAYVLPYVQIADKVASGQAYPDLNINHTVTFFVELNEPADLTSLSSADAIIQE